MSYHSGNHLIDPHELLQKAHVHEGMHIADFGCGRTGHVVFPGSKIVGERGIVYAVDILKDILETIRRRAAMEAIHNIETIWADLEQQNSISIAPKTLNVAFLINMLYHSHDYTNVLVEVSRVLADTSRIVVVDWSRNLANLGPSQKDMVQFDDIKNWAYKQNFVIQEDFPVGRYHRGMILFR